MFCTALRYEEPENEKQKSLKNIPVEKGEEENRHLSPPSTTYLPPVSKLITQEQKKLGEKEAQNLSRDIITAAILQDNPTLFKICDSIKKKGENFGDAKYALQSILNIQMLKDDKSEKILLDFKQSTYEHLQSSFLEDSEGKYAKKRLWYAGTTFSISLTTLLLSIASKNPNILLFLGNSLITYSSFGRTLDYYKTLKNSSNAKSFRALVELIKKELIANPELSDEILTQKKNFETLLRPAQGS